jgi:hypothetical protein
MKHDVIFPEICVLKLQPRHGMAGPPKKYVSDTEAAEADVNTLLTNLKADAAGLTEFAKDYYKVAAALNQENLALQSGINAIAKVYDTFETKILETVKAATFLEQRNKSLNKSFGITSLAAAELGEKYDALSKGLNTGGENVRKYAQNVNKILPGMSKMIAKAGETGNAFKKGFDTQLLGTNQILTEHLGLTGDAANSYQLYAAGAGKNSLALLDATQKWAEGFDKATGMTGTFAGIVSEIAELGADIQTQYKKMPGSLEKSIVKAKLLGTTFAKIEKMATKMLNIEESVGAELEYQLLSGKRLVDQDGNSITEKLRIAKLSGNSEKQVEAMNDLLKSQGDILDGNNHYAKEELATLTGFTVDELTRQRQMQKLKEQGGLDQAKLDNYLKMGPEQFAVAMKVLPEAQQKIISELKDLSGQKTTDELYADMLARERTEGINVHMLTGTSQTAAIGGARTEASGSYGKTKDYLSDFAKPETAKMLGSLQVLGGSMGATNEALKQFATYIPVLGETLNAFVTSMQAKVVKTMIGTPAGLAKIEPQDPAVAATATIDTPDGILVNDAMIQFHPADKFATVSDGAALLASTERGKLDSAVSTLTGGAGGGGMAIVDPAPIAAAIMASMRNMKVEVNYDVTAAASAANFKFNQGING